MSPAASTLSQLSDSGQTLSEDSGVDAGETEASTSGRGRQTANTKNKNGKELPQTERTTEGANKPVSRECTRGPAGRIGRHLAWDAWDALLEGTLIQKGPCARNHGISLRPDPGWQGLAAALCSSVACNSGLGFQSLLHQAVWAVSSIKEPRTPGVIFEAPTALY